MSAHTSQWTSWVHFFFFLVKLHAASQTVLTVEPEQTQAAHWNRIVALHMHRKRLPRVCATSVNDKRARFPHSDTMNYWNALFRCWNTNKSPVFPIKNTSVHPYFFNFWRFFVPRRALHLIERQPCKTNKNIARFDVCAHARIFTTQTKLTHQELCACVGERLICFKLCHIHDECLFDYYYCSTVIRAKSTTFLLWFECRAKKRHKKWAAGKADYRKNDGNYIKGLNASMRQCINRLISNNNCNWF